MTRTKKLYSDLTDKEKYTAAVLNDNVKLNRNALKFWSDLSDVFVEAKLNKARSLVSRAIVIRLQCF